MKASFQYKYSVTPSTISRVVNRFCKRSLNDRFFRKKLSFLKTTHSF